MFCHSEHKPPFFDPHERKLKKKTEDRYNFQINKI